MTRQLPDATRWCDDCGNEVQHPWLTCSECEPDARETEQDDARDGAASMAEDWEGA